MSSHESVIIALPTHVVPQMRSLPKDDLRAYLELTKTDPDAAIVSHKPVDIQITAQILALGTVGLHHLADLTIKQHRAQAQAWSVLSQKICDASLGKDIPLTAHHLTIEAHKASPQGTTRVVLNLTRDELVAVACLFNLLYAHQGTHTVAPFLGDTHD